MSALGEEPSPRPGNGTLLSVVFVGKVVILSVDAVRGRFDEPHMEPIGDADDGAIDIEVGGERTIAT